MNKIIPLHSLHLDELQEKAYYFIVFLFTVGVFVVSPSLAFPTLVPQNLDRIWWCSVLGSFLCS